MTTKIKVKYLVFSVLVWTIIFSSILYADYRDDYTYRAYILHDQYVGDIMVDGKLYTGVLIMDVEPLKNIAGDFNIYYDERKYGWYLSCSVDSPPCCGLVRTGMHSRLYFAGEHETRSNLVNGEAIGVRWTNPIIVDPVIRGVGSIQSGFI